MIQDPLAALSSSGFSYVVTTATPEGIAAGQPDAGDVTDSEAVGASALSRIRTIQSVAAGPHADARRLTVLWNVLFWSAIAIAATLALHVAVLGLLRWRKKPVPKMLHLPRLELLVFMMVLPMIAAAGAGLLHASSAGAVTIGVIFAVVLPFGFLIVASVFLVLYLLRKSLERRRALYVVFNRQEDEGTLSVQGSANSVGSMTTSMLVPSASPDSGAPGLDMDRSMSMHSEAEEGGPAPAPPPAPAPTGVAGKCRAALRATWAWTYAWMLRPVFGFPKTDAPSAAAASAAVPEDEAVWLGRGKWDAQFVKRYGCLFEDARGPQVLRVRSRYEPWEAAAADPDETVGSGILVPASPDGAEGALQALQTFGIVFAVTKMVLFAVIINGPGGVNNAVQVIALVLIALMHVLYLRLCTPYRLRVELAAEMVASVCDMAVFACGVALIAKKQWSSQQRHSMGVAMLALQAVGFLIFITVRLALAMRTLWKTVGPAVADMLPKALRKKKSNEPSPETTECEPNHPCS